MAEEAVNGSHEVPKEDVPADEPSDVQKEIIQQIEYYFGDSNLPRDKFMLEQIKLDNGWIPMSTMLKFQRLSKICNDAKAIAAALNFSNLMEVNEENDVIKIRRSPEIPMPEMNDERRKEMQKRTVYIKGFPSDSVMDNIINFFKEYGPIENIIMRKFKDKITKSFLFKGSVLVTFPSVEKAQEFLNLESVKHNDKELIRKFENDYIEEKKKEFESERLLRQKKKDIKREPLKLEDLPKGTVLHLKGDFKQLSREDLKEKFTADDLFVAFISFNKGEAQAFVRFSEENMAVKAIEKYGKELEVKDSKLETRLLEGEEEVEFLNNAKADREAHLQKCQRAKMAGRKNHKGGGGGRAFKHKGNRKRKGGPADDSSTPAKVAEATE